MLMLGYDYEQEKDCAQRDEETVCLHGQSKEWVSYVANNPVFFKAKKY